MACLSQEMGPLRANAALVPLISDQNDAVKAALSLPWSIPTMAQINPAIAEGGGKAKEIDDVVV